MVADCQKFEEFTDATLDVLVDDIKEVNPKFFLNALQALNNFLANSIALESLDELSLASPYEQADLKDETSKEYTNTPHYSLKTII